MKTVKWCVDTGYVGAEYHGEFEVEDYISEDEIEEIVKAEVFERINLDWSVIER